jgi:hypothetical protein
VWRHTQKNFSFSERFADEPDFAVLQVAEPTVYQFRAGGRCPRRQVRLLAQSNAVSASGGIPRDAHAIDAATYDEDILNGFVRPAHCGQDRFECA